MIAQQMNVDTISNNLANVNTTGYKKERLEFKTLLYQTLQQANLDPVNELGTRPVNLQVGLGVRPIATARMFDMGNIEVTNHPLDFAIEGPGFFTVERNVDDIAYTRDGCFKLATSEDGYSTLVTSDGYSILDIDGEHIIIPEDVTLNDISVDDLGRFRIKSADPVVGMEELGHQLDIVQFSNVQGLEAIGANLFRPTVTSGEPMPESEGTVITPSEVHQGVREMANVQVAEEMVRLIVAQRAYDLNSKVITTSDEMLQTANNLKR
jgi:flagellar basal-body rod protein FlgG